MTVRELIRQLQRVNQDYKVRVYDITEMDPSQDDGWARDWVPVGPLRINEAEFVEIGPAEDIG